MMKDIPKHLKLPEDAERTFLETYAQVKDTDKFKEFIDLIINKHPFDEIENMCMDYAESAGINKYTYLMTLILSSTDILKQRYLQKGIDEEVFWDTVSDFKCKIIECNNFYNVWGIFPKGWYKLFFDVKIIAYGRLQYQEKLLKNGKIAYAIHIPSSGPLYYEEVIDSYKKAYAALERYDGNLTAFTCTSYLLFPGYTGTVFKEGTNTYKFVKDFNILKINYMDNFYDAWRIFNMEYNGNISVLPKDTSMQRAFIEHFEKEGKFGNAFGAFMFDGENILKEEASILKDLMQ